MSHAYNLSTHEGEGSRKLEVILGYIARSLVQLIECLPRMREAPGPDPNT